NSPLRVGHFGVRRFITAFSRGAVEAAFPGTRRLLLQKSGDESPHSKKSFAPVAVTRGDEASPSSEPSLARPLPARRPGGPTRPPARRNCTVRTCARNVAGAS